MYAFLQLSPTLKKKKKKTKKEISEDGVNKVGLTG